MYIQSTGNQLKMQYTTFCEIVKFQYLNETERIQGPASQY